MPTLQIEVNCSHASIVEIVYRVWEWLLFQAFFEDFKVHAGQVRRTTGKHKR